MRTSTKRLLAQARTRQVYFFAVVAVALVVVLGGTALTQSSNPFVGTWKLNLAKSKYTSGPAPKSTTTKIEAAGAGVKYIVDTVLDGSVRHYEWTANYDGKDNPEIGNNPDADMIALTRINATTVRLISKKGGKIMTTVTSVVSGDGKTRTNTTTGTNAQGQTLNSVAVYDKQ